MVITGPALAALISRCAPNVRQTTIEAIIRVESGGQKYALFDNTSGRRYILSSRSSAVADLSRLIKYHHQVDAGLMQIDTENFAHYGLTPATVFNACTNIKAGAAIFRAGYKMAEQAGMHGQPAVFHAFEAYNSGRLFGDAHYANAVFQAASLPVQIQSGVSRLTYHHLPAQLWHGSPFSAAWKPSAGAAFKKITEGSAIDSGFSMQWSLK